jgi:hypothetical protein
MESYADNDFKDGWLQVVEVAGGDILTSSAAEQARNFLFDMQRVGGCCGWDSTTDLLQNPAFLVCAAPKACKQPFIDWAVKLVLRLSVAVLVLGTFQAVTFCWTLLVVCRTRKAYTQKVDTGDWTAAAQ